MLVEHIPEWQLTADDEAQIATLLSRCFTTDFGGRSYFQTRQHLRLAHRRDGRIVGHMALQFRAMRLGERLVHVTGLADVATDPGYRGLGIAAGLLKIAISEARASRSDFFLLFGTARLYGAAGFRPVHNPLTWIDLTGARTHDIHHEPADSLMVLPLGEAAWDEAAPLDLLGNLF